MPDTPNSMESLNFLRFLLQHLKTLWPWVWWLRWFLHCLAYDGRTIRKQGVMFATVQQSIATSF